MVVILPLKNNGCTGKATGKAQLIFYRAWKKPKRRVQRLA
jgi:hypothetical protein